LTLTLVCLQKAVGIELLGLFRRDDTNFVIFYTMVPGAIVNGVDMQSRSRWLSGELAKTLHKFFLEIVCNIILFPEENNASL
jgi:hypothetical protein